MKTELDTNLQLLDEHEASFLHNIREYGWMRTSVFESDDYPGFSYTTGLWRAVDYPEIIVFALPIETAHGIFWDIHDSAKRGEAVLVAERTGRFFDKVDGVLLPVAMDHYRNHLGWSQWFYRGNSFKCLQLVVPDFDGRFPWEPGFDESLSHLQIDLTGKDWGGFAAG